MQALQKTTEEATSLLCRQIQSWTKHNEPILNPINWSRKHFTLKTAHLAGTPGHVCIDSNIKKTNYKTIEKQTLNQKNYIQEKVRPSVNKKGQSGSNSFKGEKKKRPPCFSGQQLTPTQHPEDTHNHQWCCRHAQHTSTYVNMCWKHISPVPHTAVTDLFLTSV